MLCMTMKEFTTATSSPFTEISVAPVTWKSLACKCGGVHESETTSKYVMDMLHPLV